ncbi:MAG: SpoVR family protein, partial [Bacteroidales bacterium]|nr:SpoVR family protein [Bacteroidales bacterium]
ADKGKLEYNFQKITDAEKRKFYNKKTNNGQEAIFEVRKNFNDFTFLNTFINQDFTNRFNLFTVGKRLSEDGQNIEYYIKSRKAEDYKKMLIDNLYHPPLVQVDTSKTDEKSLYLIHVFEGKQLYKEFIADTLLAIEFLWGGKVQLETTELIKPKNKNEDIIKKRVLYTCENKITQKSEI